MLFEMYETYAEKAAPDIYNGLPITGRDDLTNAVRDAAGYELAALVVKYLDKVEEQASTLVDEMYKEKKEKAEEAREARHELSETQDELLELKNYLRYLKGEVRQIINSKNEGEDVAYDTVHCIYEEIVDVIEFQKEDSYHEKI